MNYFDNLIIGPPIYLAICAATGRPNSHNEQAVGVDYADIAAEYIANRTVGACRILGG